MTLKWTPPKPRKWSDSDRARANVFAPVLRRAGFRCEGCGRGDVALQWAHIFGRPTTGARLGEWANTSELTAALCTVRGIELGCHERLDRALDHDLRDRLRQAAADRFEATYGPFAWRSGEQLSAMDRVRSMVRFLEESR